jgi:uncharacterized repeat protein (TIGR01451 family)
MKRLHARLRPLCILIACLQPFMAVCVAQDIITTYAGDGSHSQLHSPTGIAVDGVGNLYIADSLNKRILRVPSDGVVRTFASGGLMRFPTSVASDSGGNLIVTETFEIGNRIFLDSFTNNVLKITPGGIMSLLGSRSDWYFFDYEDLLVDGEDCVAGVATDAEGNVFVAETVSHRIWKITPGGNVVLVAGTGDWGFSGDGGLATSARLSYPNGLALDTGGNLFIADSYNNRIRRITPEGIITTVAGSGTRGFSGDGGAATSAQLSYPLGVAVDPHGTLFIADSGNHRIRKVTPEGIITTIAGNGIPGFSGDGGRPTLAQLNYPTALAVDPTGNVFIADLANNRVRKLLLPLTAPTVAGISPNLGARGTTLDVMLTGTSLASPLTIEAGAGMTVTDIVVTSSTLARARLTIAPDAALGPHELVVGTELGTNEIPFTVVSPFPDLRVTTSHSGDLGVGFDGAFSIRVDNIGLMPTTSALTLIDVLPPGLRFVSGTGYSWSCSANDQTVTCTNSRVLLAGASTTLRLTVAVGTASAPVVNHTVSVSTDGDLDSSSNSASEGARVVATPTPTLRFSRFRLIPGQQETVTIDLRNAFPFEVSGTLTLSFSPDIAIPVDDPAIQFSTGGRTVAFTIPANSLETRFANTSHVGPIGFQAGTVAGTLRFSGALQAGTVEATFSSSPTIPLSAPALQAVQTRTQEGFSALITSLSTTRDVTLLNLTFNTTPAIRLSCGTVAGCSVMGQTLSLDVRSQFDQWFAADTRFGGLSTLTIPLSIDGNVHGIVFVTLRNSRGTSNTLRFTLP